MTHDLKTEAALALSIADVCARIGVGRTSVYAFIKSGALVARKCGRRTIILTDDLSDFLNQLPTSTRASHQQKSHLRRSKETASADVAKKE
jgi:excisionase family DNA binding protein